jgi:hypothetical protein
MRCLVHTLLTIGLALSASPGTASGVDDQLSSIVRIESTVDGQPKTGTGFVVSLFGDGTAFVVTAAHVVAGSQKAEVTFYSDPFQPRPAQVVGTDELDLAALKVWYVPQGVRPLAFADAARPGEHVYLVGFPNRSRDPLVSGGTVSGFEGRLLLVRETNRSFVQALPGAIIQMTLAGWRVPYAVQRPTSPPRTPSEPPATGSPVHEDRKRGFPCEGTVVSGLGNQVSVYVSPMKGASARTIPAGSGVRILDRVSRETKTWYRIEYDAGRTGFVLEDHVRPSISCY